MASPISQHDLHFVLQRAKEVDHLGKLISKAIALIEGVLDDLGEDAVAISFNGGKDCTVLLHLFAAVLLARHSPIPEDLQPNHDHRPIPGDERNHDNLMDKTSTTDDSTEPIDGPAKSPPSIPAANGKTLLNEQGDRPTATHHVPTTSFPYPPIKSVYITAPNPFPQLDQFVISSAERYGLDLYRFGGGMKAALEEYLGCGGGKGVRGVLVGTRRGDPNGDVEELAPTDPSWPSFLRIHPILNWTYSDIWLFLRTLDVPYCDLYDQGYTSLGSTKNTQPNPLLKRANEEGDGWEPAWKLTDEAQERAGRLDGSS